MTEAQTITAPPPGVMPEPRRIALVQVSLIGRDERVNTRPIDRNWVEREAKRFRWEGVGVPEVSLRSNGDYIVLDGQHRLALVTECGFGDREIECKVYEGLNLAEEAGLFMILNNNRKLTSTHRFLARVTAGDPVACTIKEIAKRHSWEIDNAPGAGIIMAVSTMEKLYLNDQRLHGGDYMVLDNTLAAITQAWAYTEGAQHKDIIAGVGALFHMYGPDLDRDKLVGVLATIDGGPVGLQASARGLKQVRRGTVATSVAEIVHREYNAVRKGRKLPPFRD